jgi:hypothetical protein
MERTAQGLKAEGGKGGRLKGATAQGQVRLHGGPEPGEFRMKSSGIEKKEECAARDLALLPRSWGEA